MTSRLKTIVKGMPVVGALLLLTGCAGMNGSFGCNAKAGRACTPVSQVNRQASFGYYDHGKRTDQSVSWSKPGGRRGVNKEGGSAIAGPIRTGERIQRVWVAPYQDLSGNYHNANAVYMVVEKPHWAGFPVSEMKPKDDDEGSL